VFFKINSFDVFYFDAVFGCNIVTQIVVDWLIELKRVASLSAHW